MKLLVVYSSVTGNTRKVAEAIARAVPGSALHPVEEAPSAAAAKDFDLVAAGYWVDKGMPDAKCRAWLETLEGCRLALFGTLGAWPDSDHARECQVKAAELVSAPEKGNTVCGSWLCQGRVDPKLIKAMQKMAPNVHPMTPERKARLAEAAKHPDDGDLASAQDFILRTARSIGFEV